MTHLTMPKLGISFCWYSFGGNRKCCPYSRFGLLEGRDIVNPVYMANKFTLLVHAFE